ncbi:MAG: Gfo/Idh/MocA family oxidoreductase [Planctomycetia bacterium]|nr:Gfo/Idh/MocA family oxidoreductase [Planctomycetia bacterium]
MNSRKNFNALQERRDFLKTSSLGPFLAMANAYPPMQRTYAADSPNERFKMGFIGCGGMGYGDACGMAYYGGDFVAFADVDVNQTDRFKNAEAITKKPSEVDCYQDYRRLLERDDIEVVGIATPDHWHVKIAVEALLAGKHVFCQKPLTLTIEENKLIRKAAQQSNKTFQVGTQQRLMKDYFMTATLLVRKGLIGNIKNIEVYLHTGPSGGPFPTAEIPQNLDWDLFLGQAPYCEFRPQRCKGTFRYWYEYSGGQFTDWGAHHVDCALWALDQLGKGLGPVEFDGRDVKHASALDDKGMPTCDDYYNTAVNFQVKTKFANGVEMLICDKNFNGILFEGTEGRIFVDRGRITGKPIEEERHKSLTEEDFIALNKGKPLEDHKANFFRCIREGGLTASDVESHTYAMNACHLCGISARLGRVIKWDPVEERILDDEYAQTMTAREARKGYELPTL